MSHSFTIKSLSILIVTTQSPSSSRRLSALLSPPLFDALSISVNSHMLWNELLALW